jgi:hypothetical protein
VSRRTSTGSSRCRARKGSTPVRHNRSMRNRRPASTGADDREKISRTCLRR